MRIEFLPQRSDLDAPVLTVSEGALLNNGEPIAEPYLISQDGETVKVLLPLPANATDAQRFPDAVEVEDGAVTLPQAPSRNLPQSLTRRQWDWLLAAYELRPVIDGVMAAIDTASTTTEQRRDYANLDGLLKHASAFELPTVLTLLATYGDLAAEVIGRTITEDEITAAFSEAASTIP